MANQKEIETMYDWVDYLIELGLGKCPDYSCALFDGNFNKSLDQAQRDKHDWVLTTCSVDRPGKCILDVGCGWGPILKAIKRTGGTGVGLTLSRAQGRYCKKAGFDVRIVDWKDAVKQSLGAYDAVISIGSFEHFCSIDEYIAGKQLQIYERFFEFCSGALKPGGVLYLQTMVWGKSVPSPERINITAPEGTPERILARLSKFYPGSWLPESKAQIVQVASKGFKLFHSNNGRLDYIETQNRWLDKSRGLFRFPQFIKAIPQIMKLLPRYICDKDFRIQIESIVRADQRQCFIDEIMSHERMFFQKL